MILKLKRTPGLYLVGFMGSGKTTVGRALAEELGWSFVDIDTEIEAKEGKSISDIFSTRGEEAFRELERKEIAAHVAAIEKGKPCVVSLGGGASVQPVNWELIQNNGVTVWLDCPIDRIERRIRGDYTRPLAANREFFYRLFEDRRPLYARADYHIEIDCDDAAEIVGKIMGLPLF
jgi:shikimate kinase